MSVRIEGEIVAIKLWCGCWIKVKEQVGEVTACNNDTGAGKMRVGRGEVVEFTAADAPEYASYDAITAAREAGKPRKASGDEQAGFNL